MMMKIRHKKIVASGTAVALAGILGVGALLQSSVSVQASPAMMPGIEQIVNDTTAEKPFKILEIVDNTSEAEIGYYVSGQEPYVKLYQYQYTDDKNQAHTITFDSLDEGLSKISDPVKRKEFAMNVKLNQDGSIDTSNSTGIKQMVQVQENRRIILFLMVITRRNISLPRKRRIQNYGKKLNNL